ncbi:MAG: DEAD/DEAH box helicase family protein [Tannerellaceae bacterium]|jgi:superfamily II DNA or RNA helicase|nr:DEAD/DEAH box helicase family protein [Tannerellaceae bacterium]
MNQSQIDYYTRLSQKGKDVLKIAALKAVSISEYKIAELFFFEKITQKFVRETLDEAVRYALFQKQNNYITEYTVRPDFMLSIYPELTDLKVIWPAIVNERGNFFYSPIDNPIAQFRNCLYTLLHEPSDYPRYESLFCQNLTAEKRSYYTGLIQTEGYESRLQLIRTDLIDMALSSAITAKMYTLTPLPDIHRFFERTIKQPRKTEPFDAMFVEKKIALLSGYFRKAIEMTNKMDVVQLDYIEAIIRVTQGEMNKAFAIFEGALKTQRKSYRDALVPAFPHIAFYYFIALQSIDSKIATPVFQKMEQWISKHNGHPGSMSVFVVLIYHVLNMKEKEMKELAVLNERIHDVADECEYLKLISVLVYYMVNRKMKSIVPDVILPIVEKAFKSGYLILAYEAAYVLKSWFDDNRSDKLFQKISSKLLYPPVLSHITHQEDWEKSVNLLLGLKLSSPKAAKEGENKTRIVYFFNPKQNFIQPMVQTRKTRSWSAGRNIALKHFFEGTVQGMSDHDLRIAKTIKHHRNYYNEYYEFTKDVYLQLAGHPYVFLENSVDISVEFIITQPIIKVSKSPKGYTLSTNVTETTERISVQKETNTRYLVYVLTDQQMQILQIITGLVIPEKGKKKLIELLGTFSAQGINVHSDLLATDGNQQVMEIPPDSRIRVQLLPYGNGLRAELFSKPFGTYLPYCKPGKGGSALITNENDIQLQVKRNLKKELENEKILLTKIQSLESLDMTGDLITFSDPLDSLSMLEILSEHQDISIVEWPEGERFRFHGKAGLGNLSIRLKSEISWFDLQGELKVDENTVVSLQQLLAMMNKSHKRFVELNPGEFLVLSNELKKNLDELRLFSTVGKKEVKVNKFASVALNDFFNQVEDLKTDTSWEEFRNRVRDINAGSIPIPVHLKAELRTYQEEGFKWLAQLAEWGAGACLADDMGLGKTVQTLAVLLHRAQQGPALVVCPLSVISNWIHETERFAPTLQIKTLGNTIGNRKELVQSLEPGDLLIISYGLIQTESELLSKQTFATLVLDEAHIIKNYATKTSKATMQLKASFRVALTGTPIQNHTVEIWNIFNFINPGLLGSLQHFSDTFIKPGNEKTRKSLKKLIAPFILRRTKTAVLDELPPKTEIVKKIQLSGEEMAFYEALRRQAIENLTTSGTKNGTKQIQALAEITKLRQASCHPKLINPNIPVSSSSKLNAFLEIVAELHENKHRALVFSQFVAHLAIVKKALDKRGISYQYLDGTTPMAERDQNVKKFQSGEGELFLISLKAGGLGLNLTAADFVIHLDPWWNPATEDQASGRVHRIGQTRPVTIYRLVAENTIEEKILQLHHTKRDLAESLLEGSDRSARLSLAELLTLIKDSQNEDPVS